MGKMADNSCKEKSNKVESKEKCGQCVMKIAILKIALNIYSKQWEKEASFYSGKNYVVDG